MTQPRAEEQHLRGRQSNFLLQYNDEISVEGVTGGKQVISIEGYRMMRVGTILMKNGCKQLKLLIGAEGESLIIFTPGYCID